MKQTRFTISRSARRTLGNETFTKDFVIKVTNVNEQPTALSLSGLTIAENSATGTQVGTFSTTDVDPGDSHTYELVSGGADNASFEIDGNALKTKAVFDYEADSVYNIKVKSSDAGGLETSTDFVIKVTNVVVKATNILLSTDSIQENNTVGDSVGRLSSSPAESDGIYSLVAGAGATDNARFTIKGDTLKANAVFDFETKTSYSIRVQTSNATGSFAKAFTIKITDNKPPSVPALTSPADEATDIALNTKLVWAASSDPEGDAITYTVLLDTLSAPKDTVSKSQVGIEYTPTGLRTGTKYYWQIVATDAGGEKAVSSIRSYTTKVCREENLTFGGKTYAVVAIGTQCWMAENLNDNSHTSGNSYCYNDQPDSCAVYGRLYDYDAAVDMSNKVTGWRLPTKQEYEILRNTIGVGKSAEDWVSSDFKLKLAGFRSGSGYVFAGASTSLLWKGDNDNINHKGLIIFQISLPPSLTGNTPTLTSDISLRLIQDK